jgi:hypothetical protein
MAHPQSGSATAVLQYNRKIVCNSFTMLSSLTISFAVALSLLLVGPSHSQGGALVCHQSDLPDPDCGKNLTLSIFDCLSLCVCEDPATGIGMACHSKGTCDGLTVCQSQFACICQQGSGTIVCSPCTQDEFRKLTLFSLKLSEAGCVRENVREGKG